MFIQTRCKKRRTASWKVFPNQFNIQIACEILTNIDGIESIRHERPNEMLFMLRHVAGIQCIVEASANLIGNFTLESISKKNLFLFLELYLTSSLSLTCTAARTPGTYRFPRYLASIVRQTTTNPKHRPHRMWTIVLVGWRKNLLREMKTWLRICRKVSVEIRTELYHPVIESRIKREK